MSSSSSSPIATTRPPVDKGILCAMGDADAGKGFLLTGDEAFTLDVCAWNAEKDGTSMVDGVGFKRAEERFKLGFVGMTGACSGLRSMIIYESGGIELDRAKARVPKKVKDEAPIANDD